MDEVSSEHSLGWDDSLDDGDLDELDRIVQLMQPKYRPGSQLVPEAKLMGKVRNRMTVRGFDEKQRRPDNARFITSEHFNGRLTAGEVLQPWQREGAGSPLEVPRVVVVTGHKGEGGNVGINGVYERYPFDYNGRPAYQKFLEKGMHRHASEPRGTRRERANERDFGANSPRSRLLLERTARVEPLTLQLAQADDPSFSIVGARNAWFIYFYEGCWCIGPMVGSAEVFARCPGAEELVPTALLSWQVYDMGLKRFRKHPGLRALKASGSS